MTWLRFSGKQEHDVVLLHKNMISGSRTNDKRNVADIVF